MTAAGRAPRSQGPRLAIVVAIVIIDVLGIGLMWPVLPVLIRELSGGDLPSASSIYGWSRAGRHDSARPGLLWI
jgi:hypothetical protein